ILIINPSKRPEVKVGRTNLMGFGVKPEVIENLLSSFHEPVIIPSQELTRYIFEQKVNESGDIILKKFVPLKNATNITMMFPRHTNDCTVFENIFCKNIQLQVDKRFYPQIEFANTWDGRFVRYQLMASELDDLEPTKEIIQSLSRPLNDVNTFYRYYEIPYDNTDFSINFQLERGNAGYVFDGLDTNTRDVLIQFKASFPKFRYSNANNTYYYPDTTSDNNVLTDPDNNTYRNPYTEINGDIIETIPPPSPEMWICSDTYWTWSVDDGVKYHHEGIPEGYE
uniref:hypothetical protein n=1 Tax=Lactobacillus taiwanensis TaxID=508451 RepID=UPI0025583AF8